MINLGSYIFEKLKLDKNISLYKKYPVFVEFYADWKDIYNLRDEINTYTDINEYGLEKLSDKPKIIKKKEVWLYKAEILNEDDLLWFLIYVYGEFSPSVEFEGIDFLKNFIHNYDDISNYIEHFTKEDYQKRINDYMSLIKNKM